MKTQLLLKQLHLCIDAMTALPDHKAYDEGSEWGDALENGALILAEADRGRAIELGTARAVLTAARDVMDSYTYHPGWQEIVDTTTQLIRESVEQPRWKDLCLLARCCTLIGSMPDIEDGSDFALCLDMADELLKDSESEAVSYARVSVALFFCREVMQHSPLQAWVDCVKEINAVI